MLPGGGDRDEIARRLDRLRGRYEPYAYALANHLALPLPAWSSERGKAHAAWHVHHEIT